MPGSTNFIAATLGLLGLALQLRPMTRRGGAIAIGVVAWLTLVFGTLLGDAAVDGHAFGGQPAVLTLLGGGVAPVLLFYMGALTLPTALYWRNYSAKPTGASIATLAGFGLVAFVCLGGQAVGLGNRPPLVIVVDSISSSPFLGDRLAASAALLPMVVAALSLLLLMRRPRARRLAPVLALVFGLGIVLPMLVLALFTTTGAHWVLALEPIKIVLIVSAGLVLLPVAAGEMMADFERSAHD